MRKWTRLGAAGTALAVVCATAAAAQTPGAPTNDHYLQSERFNEPGEKVPRALPPFFIDTTNATVQSDLMNPPQSGGPPEPTTCESAASVGKTIWYDFYPDVRGFARIRASGFDTFVAVLPFDSQTFVPDVSRRICFNQSTGTTEEAIAEVPKGGSFSIQLGGVNGAGGNLEWTFDFFPDRDGDQVLDETDRCDTLPGPRRLGGCPPRLRADSTIRAVPTANGIQVLALSVTAPRRSRVAVSCTRGCPSEVKRARSTVRFRRIRGRNLTAGSKIVIRVTRRRSIGAYIAYRITAGNFKKIERCLKPGSRKPRKRCG